VSELQALADPRGFSGLTADALGVTLVTELRNAGYALPELLLSAAPYAGFDPAAFRVQSAPLSAGLKDGDVLDLGDRSFEVLHLPGHSPGSIGLWERATGVLFSGDAIYDGPLLYSLPDSSVPDYARTLQRLLTLEVDTVHAGHDPSFGRARLREVAKGYLARFEG
jgi:glyoxylase-like metal-dependent hydrolase (beta-lactamase superfamily II)